MQETTRKDIVLADYQALAEFRYQMRRFLRFSEQAARTVGLEPQQHQLLLAVKGLPDDKLATIGTLAERLKIEHHSTVELVDRLAEKGLLERRRDEADLRRVLVSLTPSGEDILRKLTLHHRAELRTNGLDLVHALEQVISGNYHDETEAADHD